MADFSGITNPKRVIQRREDEAMGSPKPASAPASAAGGSMSQADFSGYGKKKHDPKKLAEMLRKHERE